MRFIFRRQRKQKVKLWWRKKKVVNLNDRSQEGKRRKRSNAGVLNKCQRPTPTGLYRFLLSLEHIYICRYREYSCRWHWHDKLTQSFCCCIRLHLFCKGKKRLCNHSYSIFISQGRRRLCQTHPICFDSSTVIEKSTQRKSIHG